MWPENDRKRPTVKSQFLFLGLTAAKYKVPRILGRAPSDLEFGGPLESKSFVRGPKIDPPGAQGRVHRSKCRSFGRDRRCNIVPAVFKDAF